MTYVDEVVKSYDPNTFEARPVLEKMATEYPNIKSRSVKLSQLRSRLLALTPKEGFENMKEYYKATRKVGQEPDLPLQLRSLRLKKEDYLHIQGKQQEALKEKLDHVNVVKNSKKLREEILDGLNYLSYDKLMPALLLATGRRTIEILKTGKIFKRKDKIMFKGQAKSDKKAFEIPLLAPLSLIQKGIKNLRRLFPEIVENKLNNVETQALVNKRNERLFQRLGMKYGLELTAHTMRSLYVAFAFKEYKGDKTKNGYASDILGHDDNTSQLHYINIKLK